MTLILHNNRYPNSKLTHWYKSATALYDSVKHVTSVEWECEKAIQTLCYSMGW